MVDRFTEEGATWRILIGAVRHVAEQEARRSGFGPREQARAGKARGQARCSEGGVPHGVFPLARCGWVVAAGL